MDSLDQDSLSSLPLGETPEALPTPVIPDEPNSEISEDSFTLLTPDEPIEAKTTVTSQGYGYWPFYLFFTFILGLDSSDPQDRPDPDLAGKVMTAIVEAALMRDGQ